MKPGEFTVRRIIDKERGFTYPTFEVVGYALFSSAVATHPQACVRRNLRDRINKSERIVVRPLPQEY